jgi:hypothetical protein
MASAGEFDLPDVNQHFYLDYLDVGSTAESGEMRVKK